MKADKKRSEKKRTAGDIISLVILIPSIAVSVYIMAHGLGLAPELDFGAGAYFYADMPDFQRWTDGSAYTSPVPMWVLILLFLGWGALMYRLWIFVDRLSSRPGTKEPDQEKKQTKEAA
jgi:hypothetical protein